MRRPRSKLQVSTFPFSQSFSARWGRCSCCFSSWIAAQNRRPAHCLRRHCGTQETDRGGRSRPSEGMGGRPGALASIASGAAKPTPRPGKGDRLGISQADKKRADAQLQQGELDAKIKAETARIASLQAQIAGQNSTLSDVAKKDARSKAELNQAAQELAEMELAFRKIGKLLRGTRQANLLGRSVSRQARRFSHPHLCRMRAERRDFSSGEAFARKLGFHARPCAHCGRTPHRAARARKACQGKRSRNQGGSQARLRAFPGATGGDRQLSGGSAFAAIKSIMAMSSSMSTGCWTSTAIPMRNRARLDDEGQFDSAAGVRNGTIWRPWQSRGKRLRQWTDRRHGKDRRAGMTGGTGARAVLCRAAPRGRAAQLANQRAAVLARSAAPASGRTEATSPVRRAWDRFGIAHDGAASRRHFTSRWAIRTAIRTRQSRAGAKRR